jgi:c-di-GMP phosphodiesterase
VGMFSVVDALLDSPMDVVLSSLPLSDDIRDALQRHAGPKGAVLSYERARFEDLRALAPPGVSAQEIYQSSIRWAREASVELEATSPVSV